MARVVLQVKAGTLPERLAFVVGPGQCLLGRDPECPVHLSGLNVSRRHCLLEVESPHVRIRDLGSRNGTYVNGVLIGRRDLAGDTPLDLPAEVELHPGDRVQIGNHIFEIDILSAGHDDAEADCGRMAAAL